MPTDMQMLENQMRSNNKVIIRLLDIQIARTMTAGERDALDGALAVEKYLMADMAAIAARQAVEGEATA